MRVTNLLLPVLLLAAAGGCSPPVDHLVPIDSGWVAAEPPRPLRGWELASGEGSFDEYSFAGRWSLVFVGYLSCPDVCPNTVGALSRVRDALGDSMPHVVFVSVDPARDSVARLAEWGAWFDLPMTAVTGDRAAVDHAVTQLGASYRLGEPDDRGWYTVDHSTSLFLVGPTGSVEGFVLRPTEVERVARTVREATERPRLRAGLRIDDAPPAVAVRGAYGSLDSTHPRSLRAVTSPAFGRVELHKTEESGGVARMVALPSLAVGPRPVQLTPGGIHLMLWEPREPIALGDRVPLRLVFDDGDALAVATVRRHE